jgi:hypothetical protein
MEALPVSNRECQDHCGSYAALGYQRCLECLARRRSKQMERQAELREAGFCRQSCGRKRVKAGYCHPCYEKHRKRQLVRR